MTHIGRYFVAALAALMAVSAAEAASTVKVALSPQVYTDLGAGPMILSADGGSVVYQISDTSPVLGTSGQIEKYGDPPIQLSATSHIWGLAGGSRGGVVSAIVTSGAGVVVVTNAGGSTGQGAAASATSAWPVYATIGGLAVSPTNPLSVTSPNPATITSNVQTCATTATALPNLPLVKGVSLEAVSTNIAAIYVGGAGVTALTGKRLAAGATISYSISNLNGIYLVCANNTDVISFTGN